MSVQAAARSFVFENILVDPFMADTDTLLLLQPARDLFGAPVLPQQFLHQSPQLIRNPWHGFSPAFQSQAVRLLWAITALTFIPAQLSADGGFVRFKYLGDLGLVVSHFLQGINLVSLFPGKLGVGSHSAPLTWSLEKHYPTPAYLFQRPSKLHLEVESTRSIYARNRSLAMSLQYYCSTRMRSNHSPIYTTNRLRNLFNLGLTPVSLSY